MADAADYYTKLHHQNQANASKFYYHFFYKALLVTVFVVIIPLFPSQAPEFFNQNLNSRGWEFLQLIFVGVAVSYGLFSRRNDETEKENNNNNNSKFDNAQLYVSRFLQVSSVFDDEVVDSPPRVDDGKKIQTWSNQYYRNDPVVVVEEAEQHSVLETEQLGGSASRTGEKPLFLPVRSLKSRVVGESVVETAKESVSRSSSSSSSGSGSKRFSSNLSKSRSGLDQQELEEKLKDSVVLPSPIPWRSRSGRMEMKEEAHLVPPSMEESDHSRSFKTKMSRSGRPNSASSSPSLSPSSSMSSPKKFSPSGSSSSEAHGKSVEDFVRKKSIYKSPPPPPPPPPPMIGKTSSRKTSSRAADGGSYAHEGLKRSFTSESKLSSLAMAKSVGTFRSNSLIAEATKDRDFGDGFGAKSDNRLMGAEASAMEWTGRKMDGFDRNLENVHFAPPQTTFMEFPEEEEKEEFVEEQSEMESDEETDVEEDEDLVGSLGNSFVSASSNNQEAVSSSVGDGGPDVDRKADEFIAKFREQIRIQRIESIKQSSAQISRKSPR